MENVGTVIDVCFVIISMITVGLLYFAANKSGWVLLIVVPWLLVQAVIGLSDFYQTQTIPPRFALMGVPPGLFILAVFLTARGRTFIDGLDMARLTLLHTIRIVVEIVLYFLFLAKAIPEIMTFEGRNLDIIAGLTAPMIYYFGFIKKILPASSLLLWNLVCLGLLLNIIVLAVLSAPSPFQSLGFDQPNIAISYFPYVWLPSVVVPIVLFSHLVAIRRLLSSRPRD